MFVVVVLGYFVAEPEDDFPLAVAKGGGDGVGRDALAGERVARLVAGEVRFELRLQIAEGFFVDVGGEVFSSSGDAEAVGAFAFFGGGWRVHAVLMVCWRLDDGRFAGVDVALA